MKTKFLTSWNTEQFKLVEKHIVNHFQRKSFETNNGLCTFNTGFNHISNVLGLAYTSSSAFAGYWPCNISLYLDYMNKYKLTGIALTEGLEVIAIYDDVNENSILITI